MHMRILWFVFNNTFVKRNLPNLSLSINKSNFKVFLQSKKERHWNIENIHLLSRNPSVPNDGFIMNFGYSLNKTQFSIFLVHLLAFSKP